MQKIYNWTHGISVLYPTLESKLYSLNEQGFNIDVVIPTRYYNDELMEAIIICS